MICLLGLLQLAEQPVAGPSISERQIVEGDNFQKYGGMDQCIYMQCDYQYRPVDKRKKTFVRTLTKPLVQHLNPLCYSLFAELPEEGPEIKGGLPNYQLNDRLELNCTSQRTFPPTLLKWYINNEPVSPVYYYI